MKATKNELSMHVDRANMVDIDFEKVELRILQSNKGLNMKQTNNRLNTIAKVLIYAPYHSKSGVCIHFGL